ncbi:hypothetical protein M3Y99_01626500 [Aphelenchoides fujianensis]|nr:hypothetical protein M3Y99_01626500 [Aphelenchoides fujianensis]
MEQNGGQDGCDVAVHVKSDTDKRFTVQVTAPNGQTQRWTFGGRREEHTLQLRRNDCVEGDWKIETFNDQNALINTATVRLSGVGRVEYAVDDSLAAKQVERQGVICEGACAPLGGAPGARPVPRPFNNH